jgi:serine phosphatase RsbU (regulator of sigma subunit)
MDLPQVSRLYIFSDGIYEVTKPDGTMMKYTDFAEILAGSKRSDGSVIEQTLDSIRALHGADQFEDDVSIVGITF